ncbi:protein of unknown function [Limnospira indica PCC 8005]|uniref:Uncharacterized protein n=1 Tax=Limnospira indica PCC 8005 TaxID=376219 RepID=A0A9P1NYS1_9CYAN|nr:protein of unknown function [Limnospira indica PCC 8005]
MRVGGSPRGELTGPRWELGEVRELESFQAGKLESWEVGKLESWKVGKLGSWEVGKSES